MSKKSEYVPYENWSRNDYRMAYEEAERLRAENFEELKKLRGEVERLKWFENSNMVWMQHATILGRTIDRLLSAKSE